MSKAFLVVICDEKTNAPINAEVWSSPEWQQSMFLPEKVFILYETHIANPKKDTIFQHARDELKRHIESKYFTRYHWVIPYLNKDRRGRDLPVKEWEINYNM